MKLNEQYFNIQSEYNMIIGLFHMTPAQRAEPLPTSK